MKKKSLIVTTAALIISCAVIAAFSVDYGPVTVMVDDTTKATNRYLGITFKHTYHTRDLGITCVTCHHTEKADFVSGIPVRCDACHKADAEISFKDAMHKSCVMCHIDMTAEGKTPPVECLNCHTQRN